MQIKLLPFYHHFADLIIGTQVHIDKKNLELHYQLQGNISQVEGLISSPENFDREPKMNLWEKTCFEFFLSPEGKSFYYEFNVNPFGQWMIFRFSELRQGRQIISQGRPRLLKSKRTENNFELQAAFEMQSLTDLLDTQNYKIQPTCVIQFTNQQLDYYAPSHADKPDFHDPQRWLDFILSEKEK